MVAVAEDGRLFPPTTGGAVLSSPDGVSWAEHDLPSLEGDALLSLPFRVNEIQGRPVIHGYAHPAVDLDPILAALPAAVTAAVETGKAAVDVSGDSVRVTVHPGVSVLETSGAELGIDIGPISDGYASTMAWIGEDLDSLEVETNAILASHDVELLAGGELLGRSVGNRFAVSADGLTWREVEPGALTRIHVHLIVEGRARRVRDDATLLRASEAFNTIYGWPTVVAGDELDAPYGAPTSGGPPYAVYEITPTTAFGLPTDGESADADPLAIPDRWRRRRSELLAGTTCGSVEDELGAAEESQGAAGLVGGDGGVPHLDGASPMTQRRLGGDGPLQQGAGVVRLQLDGGETGGALGEAGDAAEAGGGVGQCHQGGGVEVSVGGQVAAAHLTTHHAPARGQVDRLEAQQAR